MSETRSYTVYFDGFYRRKSYQFITEPIRARARPKSARLGERYPVLNPTFGVRDAGGSTLIGDGKLTAVERSMQPDQKAVSFCLQTTGKLTYADFRAIKQAGSIPLEVSLQVVASMGMDLGNLMPLVPLPARPISSRFAARVKFDYSDMDLIQWRMYPVVLSKAAEGYFVANPDPLTAVWNTRIAPSAKGGVCGDYRGWGIEWSREFIEELFGPGCVLTWIHVGAPFAERKLSHAATLAILPDGSRYVLDYWMSVMTKRPRVFDSAFAWRHAATDEVLELAWARPNPSALSLYYAPDMDNLSGYIAAHGETAGIQKYLDAPAGSDPARVAAIAARREALVRSYRRAKW